MWVDEYKGQVVKLRQENKGLREQYEAMVNQKAKEQEQIIQDNKDLKQMIDRMKKKEKQLEKLAEEGKNAKELIN